MVTVNRCNHVNIYIVLSDTNEWLKVTCDTHEPHIKKGDCQKSQKKKNDVFYRRFNERVKRMLDRDGVIKYQPHLRSDRI